MSSALPNYPDSPVLVLTAIGNDARNAAAVLASLNLATHICADMRELCHRAAESSGALLLGEDSLDESALDMLLNYLSSQPPWSDVPVILLTKGGDVSGRTYKIFNSLGARGNVTLLEKPVRALTLVSIIQAALRSRARQYEVRQLLQSQAHAREAAETTSAKLRAVFDQSSIFAGILSRDGELMEANRLWMEACGNRPGEVIGHPLWKCIWWHGLEGAQEKIRQATAHVAGGGTYQEVLPLVWQDGTEHLVEFSLSPIRDERGQLLLLHVTGMDVTARQKAEGLLRQNETLFSALVEQAPTGVYVVDAQFRLQQINALALPAFEKVHPRIGRDFSEVMEILWGPKLSAEIVKIFRHTLATGERYISPRFAEFRHDLGVEKAYEWETQRVTLADGQHGVVCYFNDVTERHQAQARNEFLSQLTQKLSTVSDVAEINRIATSEIGRFLNVDRCYFFEPLPGGDSVRVLADWHHPSSPSLQGVYRLQDFGQPELWEAVRQRPVSVDDVGSENWTMDYLANYQSVHIAAFHQAPFIHEGKWVACMAISSARPRHWSDEEKTLLENAIARVWPLIERAMAEQALRESERKFRALGENIAPLTWMAHADGSVFWYNKRWYDYTGTTFEEMQGWRWKKVHDPAHLARVVAKWEAALRDGILWEDTFPIRGADGQFRWFLSRAFPIRDPDGAITQWFGTNTDVTELRAIQESLREANALLADKAVQLETLVQQRTHRLRETVAELETYSYSIAHDLRSPLRSLQGYSLILLAEHAHGLDESARHYLRRIAKAAARMDKLISDVLSYSRVARTELRLEQLNLLPILRGIADTYPMLAPDKVDLALIGDFPPILGNEAMLTQILSNIMCNAVKFVSPGVKPQLKVWTECRGDALRIFIQDNGIGISPAEHERIFGMFQQVDQTFEGTGIGLAIVKKAAERLGGRVGLVSELGKGSTFWLEFKLATKENDFKTLPRHQGSGDHSTALLLKSDASEK